MFECRVLEN